MEKDMKDAVDLFYETFTEFYKKCGDSNLAIRLTCAITGLNVPESNGALFGINFGGKRNNTR